MYVETVNPTKSEGVYYAQGVYPCGNSTGILPAGTVPVQAGSVRSWRGKKDVKVCREFSRFSYLIHGNKNISYCNTNGSTSGNFMDGGYLYTRSLAGGHPWVAPIGPVQGPDTFSITDEDERYRTHLIAELFQKANEPEFNGATFLAELGESVYYVRDLLRSIIRITRFTKDVLKRGANPQDAWLEWRYAIQPIMLTVEDVCSLLAEKQRPKEKVQAYKAHEPQIEITEHTYTAYNSQSGPKELNFTSKVSTEISVGAGLWVQSQNDLHPFGSGLQDWIAAGWEIVPASFIWDWFIDVGTWIGSFRNTDLKVERRYATLVKREEIAVWFDASSSWISVPYDIPSEGDPLRLSVYHIDRIVDDDVTPPFLPSIVPGKLSLIHKLDALALTIGLLKGLRR